MAAPAGTTPVVAAPVVPAPAPPPPAPAAAAPVVVAAPEKPAAAPPPPAKDEVAPPLPAATPAAFVPPPMSDAAAPPPPVLGNPLQAIAGQAPAPMGHCSWDDLLIGALPTWATLTIFSTVAFLLGCLLTGLLARWRHNAAFYGDAAAARAADAEALPSPAAEYVGRRRPDAWKTPGTKAKEAAVRASGVTGPLGVGAVVSSMDGGGSGRGSGSGRPSAEGGGGGALPAGPRRSSAAGSNLAPAITAASTPAVRAAYEVEDLDDEWRALVAEVDARLAAKRAKPCDARERALVVRALLASGPAEAADDALDRAALAVRDGRGGRGV